jgi:hypothetical protein
MSQYFNMHNACDLYLNGANVNQWEVVPHSSITHFGLDELDLSYRAKKCCLRKSLIKISMSDSALV